MIRWLVVLVCVLGAASSASGQDVRADPLWTEAVSAYESGDYTAAARLFALVLERDGPSAAGHVNLAHSHFQQGDLGQALLHYLRAYRLSPRDPAAGFGVGLVRAVRVDVQTEPRALLDNLAGATEGVLTVGELGALGLLLSLGTFVMGALRLLGRASDRVVLALAALSLAVLVLLGGRLAVDALRPAAVVTAFEVTAHSGPGEDYPALFTLYAAAELRVTGTDDAGWVRVALPDGRLGWLPADAVTGVVDTRQ